MTLCWPGLIPISVNYRGAPDNEFTSIPGGKKLPCSSIVETSSTAEHMPDELGFLVVRPVNTGTNRIGFGHSQPVKGAAFLTIVNVLHLGRSTRGSSATC